MEFLEQLAWLTRIDGAAFVTLILDFARLLTGREGAPGWVSLVLICVLVVLVVWHIVSVWQFHRAVNDVRSIVSGNGPIDWERLIDVQRKFEAFQITKNRARKLLSKAWDEFLETTVEPDENGGKLRNTVRPNVFFAREELGLEHGLWRQVPALFVSVGLFLTFLGLVAALDQTSRVLDAAGAEAAGATTEGLKTLLRIAGAKFIMSLTGLACSIVFTLVLRRCTRWTDAALRDLCADIEKGCDFQSEQGLLRELLDDARAQTHHLMTFSTELVAQVARPLKEDLPAAIRDAIAPVAESISRNAGKGMENVAESVGGQIVGGVQDAVGAMNEAVGQATERLDDVAGRLDASAREMALAAETLSRTIEQGVRDSAEAGGRAMAEAVGQAGDAMRDKLLEPVNVLVERVDGLSSAVETATARVGTYAESVEDAAGAVGRANDGLEQSGRTLAEAAEPVRGAAAGIETAARSMGDKVEEASTAISEASQAVQDGARATAEHTEATLRGVREAIEASQTEAREALRALEGAVERFRDVADRYDEIDASLGQAFETVETQVKASVAEIERFAEELNKQFADALSRLETVIAQAEPFTPRREV